jgi:acyl-CoA thioesterase
LAALPEVMPIPKLFSNYDIRMLRGNIAPLPQAEEYVKDSSETLLWVRDKPVRAMDFTSLTAMADIFFPRIFVRRQRPAAAGTISLTIHFHADSQALATVGDEFVLGLALAKRFYNGYADQVGEVWSKSGVLLATTSQTVYYKD